MGTNYYLVLSEQNTDVNLEDLKQSIQKASTLNEIVDLVQPHNKAIWREHIGKSSYGWKFLFNNHDWKHFKTITELKNWLKSGIIKTEYDCEPFLTFDEFWKMVESKQYKKKHAFPTYDKEMIKYLDGYDFYCGYFS